MNKKMIPIEGCKNFYRDTQTGAVVNCDDHEYSQYMRLKNQRKNEKNEIESMKNDIMEIKSMLRQILDNGNK
jgi:hypothetical protein